MAEIMSLLIVGIGTFLSFIDLGLLYKERMAGLERLLSKG